MTASTVHDQTMDTGKREREAEKMRRAHLQQALSRLLALSLTILSAIEIELACPEI